MVSSFSRATHDFAAMNLTLNFPFSSSHLTYATAPNASSEVSEKIPKVGGPMAVEGVRHLSKLL
jgi:hypothetical protein